MTLATLISHLHERFQHPLPGLEAQMHIYSEVGIQAYEKVVKRFDEENQSTPTRQSSVLILLYEKENVVYIPLIKRPEYDGVHSGQIGLPGGKSEPEDADDIVTALRETQEEIGIPPEQITILGKLTPVYIAPSRFWVNVVVGFLQGIPEFRPDPYEVASIIEFPLSHVNEPHIIEERKVIRMKEFTMHAPGYVYEEHFIWGATSMMLSELKILLQ